jgi:protein-tyrosine phosphatase
MTFYNLTEIPLGLPGAVYRAPLPYGTFDQHLATLAEMQQAKVEVVYSLVEPIEWTLKATRDAREPMSESGIQRVDFPIQDFGVPQDAAGFQAAVAGALQHAQHGRNIAVHCNAGMGRTGLFLVEMVIQHFGWGVSEAVDWLRKYIPYAVENEDQYQFLLDLHEE